MLTQHISAAAATAFDVLGVTVSFLSVFTNAERVNLGLTGAAKYRIVFDMSERDAAFKKQQKKEQLCAPKGVFFLNNYCALRGNYCDAGPPRGKMLSKGNNKEDSDLCKRYFFLREQP